METKEYRAISEHTADEATLLSSASQAKIADPADASHIDTRFHIRMAIASSTYLAAALILGKLTQVHIDHLFHTAATLLVGSAMVLLLPAYWHHKGKANLRDAALTIPWLFVLFTILPMPIVPAARLGLPLQDANLASFDKLLGVQVPVLVAWASHHWLGRVINRSYAVLTPMLAISFWIPALTGKVKHIQLFLAANMALFIVGLSVFALLPAIGPWYGYHFAPTADQLKCQTSILSLRIPGKFIFQPAPIVCFPSFHVAWAILCGVAYWTIRPLRIPYCIVALMIIISTMTTGWHYFSDVLGGIALALVSLALAKAFTHNCGSKTTEGLRTSSEPLRLSHEEMNAIETQ